MTSIATDSWEEQATEIRFSRKVREIPIIGSPSLSVKGMLVAAAHTATAAPRAGLEHLQRPGSGQFTKSEGDPHNRVSLTFREREVSGWDPCGDNRTTRGFRASSTAWIAPSH